MHTTVHSSFNTLGLSEAILHDIVKMGFTEPTPSDLAHHGIKLEKDCLACHVKGGERPMKERHPRRQDCLRCHRSGI